MYVKFTNTDSTGAPVTDRLTVAHDGETHEIDVAETGTARVPGDLGQHLVESDDYAVESHDPDESDDAGDSAGSDGPTESDGPGDAEESDDADTGEQSDE